MNDGTVPAGMNGWAVIDTRTHRVVAMCQGREIADLEVIRLGRAGYEVRFGVIEKNSGNFIPADLQRNK